MIDLNERAWRLLRRTLPEADSLGWAVERRPCGALVVDAGAAGMVGAQAADARVGAQQEQPRQTAAVPFASPLQPHQVRSGLHLAKICTSGLSTVRMVRRKVGGHPWPHVQVDSRHPFLGCFISQAAAWPVDVSGLKGGLIGMGSGPACLKALPERFSALGLEDPSDHAVLVLESSALPDDEACREIAERCRVSADHLAVLAARTSSPAGSIQIAARSIETALHKLDHLGFDLGCIVSGTGICPAAAPTESDLLSMGKTNDAMLFGSQVWLVVAGVDVDCLARIVAQAPSATSRSYGKPFLDILQESGGFYNIDPGLFAPAQLAIIHKETGRVLIAGTRDEERLMAALTEDRQ